MISLCMVIRNEQGLLTDCLNDVKNFVGEIVIVDQSSTDGSFKLAGQFTRKVFIRPSSDFHETDRQFSIDQASNPWILVLNADERLDGKLKSNLDQLIRSGFDAFLLPVKNLIDNVQSHNGETFQLRFFKKDALAWPDIAGENPILYTENVGKIGDGFIVRINNEEDVPEPSEPGGIMEKHESAGSSTSTSACDKQSVDLAAHLKLLETQSPQMTDDEARYRLLYELSLS
jgi:glycosyltransferase involved in cell wall biosynthesis